MKMYYLTYDGYGSEFHVMSDSPENAFKAIKNHILEKEKEEPIFIGYHDDILNSEINNLPSEYNLVEFEANKVVGTEVS